MSLAELTRLDLHGAQAGHVQASPPIEETNAANRGWEVSAFQDGKCSAESWDFREKQKKKPQKNPKQNAQPKTQLCKQSHPTKSLAARLMLPRIKCLLSSDIVHVLQITSIKACPGFRSVSIIRSSQNTPLNIYETTPIGGPSALQRSGIAVGSAVQDMPPAPFNIPPAPSTACQLSLGSIFSQGWGDGSNQAITNTHTNPPARLLRHPEALCHQGTAAHAGPPQAGATSLCWAETGLKPGGKALGLQQARRLLKLAAEREVTAGMRSLGSEHRLQPPTKNITEPRLHGRNTVVSNPDFILNHRV
ncbi:uncharacterized protein LOC119144925 [Falco rusticolus]|uniref:uncharacterized protein LOC119144925 n=1 Tax=Falco rusticolus TaxID=120794 RepID=UPI0018868F77|nr:uncharacterized protein LOC119144925 [Falco rusticolus]